MSVLIQDGRTGGHMKWALDAIGANVATGIVISPFHTPRVAAPYHRAGSQVSSQLLGAGGEVVFDPATHARMLPGTNDLVHYDSWQLWGSAGVGLDTDARRFEHIERVFATQDSLATPHLGPTLPLDSPFGQEADNSLRTCQITASIDPGAWQSLAAKRSFWRTGVDLDAYVGQLASFRSPCWVITVMNDLVADGTPDFEDTAAFEGLLRTVHSLSLRSRVVLCHADYMGLPAVAAGADTVGAGWARGMRFFDPRSFQQSAPGQILIPASYVTQGRLAAVLRRDAGEAIARLDSVLAHTLRGGPMPADDAAERIHHLSQLSSVIDAIAANGNRGTRVGHLRAFYEQAQTDYNGLIARLPARTINPGMRKRWVDDPHAALRDYASAEGLW